jgi:transposase
MNEERIAMSQRERDRLRVMSLVLEGQRRQKEAAALLKLTVRQVRRLQRRLEAQGDKGVVHRLRGRPSNRRHADTVRQRAIEIYRGEMGDFSLAMAAEKLQERGIAVPPRTLRDWLTPQGLWKPRRKGQAHRQWRQRRACLGELVQADGSHHDWLEGRGPWMVLLAFIDDATSKVTARFYEGETTEAYMDLLRRYLRKRGRMAALYVDRDSIFRAEDHDPYDPRPVMTQFSRALKELEIDLILAYSPQAKGRVERLFQTAQDRLVKELRLAGATTMAQANRVLEKVFLPWFNRWCGVKPASPNDAHRPLHPSMRLDSILSLQVQRTVSSDYTIRLDNQMYQLHKPALAGLRGGKVTIEQRLDGTMHIRFKKTYLAYHPIAPGTLRETRAARNGLGALPPDPRSLTLRGIPADGPKPKGCATEATQPSAVHSTLGRSGRTPAEPYPSKGQSTLPKPQPYRPPPDHPWRRKADISIQRI